MPDNQEPVEVQRTDELTDKELDKVAGGFKEVDPHPQDNRIAPSDNTIHPDLMNNLKPGG